MKHSIISYMPTVFLPVNDLKRSIEWYCELFEIPVQPKQDGGGIYYFAFDGTDIILDSNMQGFPPMIMFDTTDIDEAYAFCQEEQFTLPEPLHRYPDVSFFKVDGHMVCQVAQRGKTESLPVHPLLQRITRVIAHAEPYRDLEQWYRRFLRISPEQDPLVDGLSSFRMESGAHLLIDDNRLSHTEKVRFDRLQLDLRVNPVLLIESPDLEAARQHVLSKCAHNVTPIEERLGIACFNFYDHDGNGLMVYQS